RVEDLPRRCEPVVCERRDGGPDQVGRDVRAECLEPVVRVSTVDGLDEERAELIEAFVTGPTVMMIATTTRPITSPAQPSGERLSTIPSTVNMRIPVASASMNIAEPQLVVAWLKFTTPKP